MTHLEIIGRVWSDWSITEKLGEGSFGQVFKAEKKDSELHRKLPSR